jgi:thiamine biosynthesis lipoprotein
MTATANKEPRTVHVEHCMGTVFSVDIRDPGAWGDAISDVVAWLHRVDALFSTYRADSDISRLRRGELAAADADPLVAEVLGHCAVAQEETGGYFTAQWRGPRDAAPDPTGLVKGWAIERASGLLREHGSRNHAVNGGGDIQIAGESAPGQPWRVGVTDPFDRNRVLAVVTGRDIAVATSGVAERGSHIVNPRAGIPADELASVTIVGRSLTWADAYATAAFAMGAQALAWAEALPGHEALAVSMDGSARATSGFGGVFGGGSGREAGSP